MRWVTIALRSQPRRSTTSSEALAPCEPHYADETATRHHGDCRELLPDLRAELTVAGWRLSHKPGPAADLADDQAAPN
jgi:hypothetical protein